MSSLILLSPEWPGEVGGYSIATRSSLFVYSRIFSHVHYICISDRDARDSLPDFPNVTYYYVGASLLGKFARFCLSVVNNIPATSYKYFKPRKSVFNIVREIFSANLDSYVLGIEDIPLGVYIPLLEKRFNFKKIFVRSHDIMIKAYANFAIEGGFLSRMAWRYELSKISKNESYLLLKANDFFCITGVDRDSYLNHYFISRDIGVFDVFLSSSKYINVTDGDLLKIIYIGTNDERKAAGIDSFLKISFPLIKNSFPDSCLYIAGKGSEVFDNPNGGVFGLGFVESDVFLLSLGKIFINPQLYGSGLQLKSVVALLSKKLLLTLRTGAEGVLDIESCTDLVHDDYYSLAEAIIRFMRDPSMIKNFSEKYHLEAVSYYSEEEFIKRSLLLFSAYSAGG